MATSICKYLAVGLKCGDYAEYVYEQEYEWGMAMYLR